MAFRPAPPLPRGVRPPPGLDDAIGARHAEIRKARGLREPLSEAAWWWSVLAVELALLLLILGGCYAILTF